MTSLVKSILVCVSAMCCSLTGCLAGCDRNREEVAALVRMSSRQRQEAFRNMPPQKQLDLYLSAGHGEPGYNFASEIAGNWKDLFPRLKERLSSESDDSDRTQLLLAIIGENYCSLYQRKDVIDAASEAIAKMQPSRRADGRGTAKKVDSSRRAVASLPVNFLVAEIAALMDVRARAFFSFICILGRRN